MQLRTSYRQILSISVPIMLGSAVQNVIALTDSVFLFHLSETDFAAIGFVGVFYLVISAIGYSFSKGGQIMIARRLGEGRFKAIGRTFYAMAYFELVLAVIMFLFMQFGAEHFFSLFVRSDAILTKSLEYLDYRSYGVFFGYLGVAIIALYTGVARTGFIIFDTVVLAVSNIVLNYGLIFGQWGLPEMGIAGAGLASTIAEALAFICFVLYILWDRRARPYRLFQFRRMDLKLVRQMFLLSSPVVVQMTVGLGTWFVFFSFIEQIGERELAVSNLVRIVYLVLSIPCWGFASGINTLVSNFIGMRKRQGVIPIIWKTAKITLAATMLLAIPIALFPDAILSPLFGGADQTLIAEAQPILWLLLVILAVFSFGAVYFNGLTGTGATFQGLQIQVLSTIVYVIYIVVVIKYLEAGLLWAWASEIFYWIVMIILTMGFLQSRRWHGVEV